MTSSRTVWRELRPSSPRESGASWTGVEEENKGRQLEIGMDRGGGGGQGKGHDETKWMRRLGPGEMQNTKSSKTK